jgi:hypothetical protein
MAPHFGTFKEQLQELQCVTKTNPSTSVKEKFEVNQPPVIYI